MLETVNRACTTVLIAILAIASIPHQASAQLPPPVGSLIVTITSPASGSTVGGAVPVSASVSIVGTLTVSSVQFQLDGANLGAPDTSAPYSVSWDTTAAGNGSHTLTAVARDGLLGLTFSSARVTVTVNNAPPPPPADTTPPAVSVASPGNGATIQGTVPISAGASDNVGVAGVQFRIDGANFGAEDTSAPYSVSWNTTTASNGSHTITAVARDAAGNRTTSAPVTVMVSNTPPPPPPADTTPPTVSITSPSNGATIHGTVTVTADAADNVGVVGVQFQLDGVNGGPEDTTAPYSIPFDTTSTSDGVHTITAVARDAAGNRTTSAPVSVTVANNAPPPPPPPPASGARFEETDPSVTFTPNGGWTQDASRPWSGAGAAFSTTPGAQATFTFTGTSVTWIGGRATGTGIARVSLDGVFLRDVDTYSKTEEVRVSMFTASGLANTSHTLTIEATGRQNAAARAAFIIVDAFDVPTVTVSRLQETDPDIAYSPAVGGWTQGDTSRAWSAGSAALSTTTGAQATFNFTGTGISWIGARGPQTGIARVTLDGVVQPPVDTYSPVEQIQAEVFVQKGLADTSHTLTIEVTGQQNAASTSPAIVVDAFEVTMSGTRHQDTDPAIAYGDGWIQDNRDKAYSEGASAESQTVGAQATISFTGTGIRWIGARGPQTGIARALLDGNVVADSIDTFARTEGSQHTDFFASGLPAGPHTLTIQVTGKNPLSTNAWILIDAFDVIP